MHELSVAQQIVSIIFQYLPNPVPNSIKSVKVNVGKMSNILADSLTFCFEAITSDTTLKGVKLEIIETPVKINCSDCNEELQIELPIFVCPVCGNNQIKIVSGTELLIQEIELFDKIQETE